MYPNVPVPTHHVCWVRDAVQVKSPFFGKPANPGLTDMLKVAANNTLTNTLTRTEVVEMTETVTIPRDEVWAGLAMFVNVMFGFWGRSLSLFFPALGLALVLFLFL